MVTFDPDKGWLICDLLASGKTIREIEKLEGMPTRRAIHYWLAKGVAEDAPEEYREFFRAYRIAQELFADHHHDEILRIADDDSLDYKIVNVDGELKQVLDKENINRSRLRVDARKWSLARANPKKYGDKITQEVTGPEGGPLVKKFVDGPPQETFEEWKARKEREASSLDTTDGAAK